ncbi:uncharacterized protein LOC130672662 [Microplitis mediator]|uniref:uncharacterized protein LOC130672662 n=1 Tax=Microplitis mediator TaxID=375433 RepID=UPI002555ECA4|nr:uncharacterized protein LOC130672662 [Microplitis mediator]
MSRPTRQLSLQQPGRGTQRSQIRRQKSADGSGSAGGTAAIYDTNQRSKKPWNGERPKVRIAWSSTGTEETKVEVVASRIGTSSGKNRGLCAASGSLINSDKATILYSRQELAERLRLAWKQREANKSNIDIFLAHETVDDSSSRCESRLSTISCDLLKNDDKDIYTLGISGDTSGECEDEPDCVDGDKDKVPDARAKRASFQSGTNAAFMGPIDKTFIKETVKDISLEKKERAVTPDYRVNKRTNSAPPLQRRGSPLTLGHLGAGRSKVNIVIDTPKISRPRDSGSLRDVRIDRKDAVVKSLSPHDDSKSTSQNSGPADRVEKNHITKFITKKRIRTGKRRVEECGSKKNESKLNPDVITMVSLVSDADSDSEVERNSPRDDKLVRQLRSNLPTTPIIKGCSSLMMNTNNLSVFSADNSLMPSRRPLKSVSFQQDSIDGELTIRPRSEDKKTKFFNESLSKVILQAELDGAIRTSPLDEMKRPWLETNASESQVLPSGGMYWKSPEDCPLTDREKRCLVVPIGDPQDKKRKLLLQRTKSVPCRTTNDENQLTMQIEAKEPAVLSSDKQTELSSITRTDTDIFPKTSISKILQRNSFDERTIDIGMDNDGQTAEPVLGTTKEKECWHLYRRMCDKGVCVSFDTVLRGMLTPTEYRLRRREIT